MKKLLLIYLSCIILVLTLPALISKTGKKDENQTKTTEKIYTGQIPEEIKVYFKDTNEVKLLNFEEYIKGVIPAEMPGLFEKEAKKAQAVAARTYAYHKYLKFTENPTLIPTEHKEDAVICTDSTHCNAYFTKEQLVEKFGQNWFDTYYPEFEKAVDETAHQICIYENEPILAVFHSASAGGLTQNCSEVWGGDLPYLVSVKSTGESEKDGFISVVSVPTENFKKIILEKYPKAKFSDNPNEWIGKTTKTEAGYIDTVEIGGVTIDATDIRTMFNLKSTYFTHKIVDNAVVFTTEGSGHGIGMSQYGANYMAKCGADYIEILENYYSGAKVVEY